MAILKFKDENGNFVDIPVIEGKPGKQGEPGPQGPKGEPGKDGVSKEYVNQAIEEALGTINSQLSELTTVEEVE